MSKTNYQEIRCKSAVNKVQAMPFGWSLNPYRGCIHACHYCYARATHAWFGLNADDDFSSQIFVKVNLSEVLEAELAKRSWKRETVAIGTATDAYQPIEGKYELTRAALEIMHRHGTPAGIVTKSTLVERDIDILADLAQLEGSRVWLTITTLDEALWKAVEPGTPSPAKRLQTLSRLAAAGVRTGVLMHPLLPGLTDSDESIGAVAAATRDAGGSTFSAAPLRLDPLVREHYLEFINQHFPHLNRQYEGLFKGGRNADQGYVKNLGLRVEAIRQEFGLAARPISERATGNNHEPKSQVLPAAQLPLFL